ncbi:DUF2460 domain-containing protein [Sphingomicrobium arenosum]|uniref:DUF2460 domain-containing protein n=1 Tax=Sphingomicrobium arenosum TaxID=2233861 RepID=UPI00223F7266|nr:DUF2460 domain-containing protein [Sphingomicrobium arenosum]
MIRHWLTRPGEHLEKGWLKRFDPEHWTVDFPRGTIACIVTGTDGHSLEVEAEFLRRGDLVGLIWESEDRWSHPAHARATSRDYSGTRLSFRWQSTGLIGLDQPNGPTLTIEGRDAQGVARSWYVRLWNYAEGTAQNARIELDFDSLAGGWAADDPVAAGDIERLFVSLAPHDYAAGDDSIRTASATGTLMISDIVCAGPGSVIEVGSSWQPDHGFGACSAYDDLYHLPPSRVAEAIDRLGFGQLVNHYVGMSHYMALGGDGRVDSAKGMNGPALHWHEAYAAALAARGRTPIWSISYEILAQFCPEAWAQRRSDGAMGLTGWSPPSALVSPCSEAAIGYLGDIIEELLGLSAGAGLSPMMQIGEPWWWIDSDRQPCLYDASAQSAFEGPMPLVHDVTDVMSSEQIALLDWAGEKLAASTAALVARAKVAAPQCETHLLVYLPSILDPDAPELSRANLPVEWAAPAFDKLQIEDYDWVTSQVAPTRRETACAAVEERLGYPPDRQHYLAGFVLEEEGAPDEWRRVIAAAADARARQVDEVFIWALPQVLRDGVTIFETEDGTMQDVADVDFPIALGSDVSVRPGFSTQVVVSASGHEYRNADWQQARNEYDAGPGVRSEAELQVLLGFFRARRGRAEGFRLRDPFDHRSGSSDVSPFDQEIGTGDGATMRFALTKGYGEGEKRRITRPVTGSVRVAIDGIEQPWGWTLSDKGYVDFDSAPATGAVVTAGFQFDVPVRFASDQLEINRATFMAGEAPSVPLVEVREG